MSSSISAIINFHGEGVLAHPSINSFLECCAEASSRGIKVEKIAILDKITKGTKDVVDTHKEYFDKIELCSYGDIGLARNFGVSISNSEYVAFFDADDLWCKTWLTKALAMALSLRESEKVVFHPEYAYCFFESDFLCQSADEYPNHARSAYFYMTDSASENFDGTAILFNNLYTSNSFGRRMLYEKYPLPDIQRSLGYGVEDWWWNAKTLSLGIRHAVVLDTVHLVRNKENGSLSATNVKSRLLPPLHLYSDSLMKI